MTSLLCNTCSHLVDTVYGQTLPLQTQSSKCLYENDRVVLLEPGGLCVTRLVQTICIRHLCIQTSLQCVMLFILASTFFSFLHVCAGVEAYGQMSDKFPKQLL